MPEVAGLRPSRTPHRLSAPDPETEKPSTLGGVFLWIAFIVPMIFVYFAFNSIPMVLLLLVIRIAIMFIPTIKEVLHIGERKPVASPAGKQIRNARREREVVTTPVEVPAPEPRVASAVVEELKSEVYWVLEKLHLRNAKEEERLALYRNLRGWD